MTVGLPIFLFFLFFCLCKFLGRLQNKYDSVHMYDNGVKVTPTASLSWPGI